MLEKTQLELAQKTLPGLKQQLVVEIQTGDGSHAEFAKAMVDTLQQLADAAQGKLVLHYAEEDLPAGTLFPPADPAPKNLRGLPWFAIKNICYRAVPLDQEFLPFLEVLQALASPSPALVPLASTASPDAEALDPAHLDPAQLDLLIAPTCPNCPRVVTACAAMAARWPQLRLTIIDVQYFAGLAGKVRSVPTVVIDQARMIVGTLSQSELLRLLQERGSAQYAQQALASLLEGGRIQQAIPWLEKETGQEALARLMTQSSMQVRMGLLLLAEQALSARPHCLDSAVPLLLPLLESEDIPLRGDTADLLGKIGAPGARAGLTRLLQDPDPDVREVAADSLTLLRQPS